MIRRGPFGLRRRTVFYRPEKGRHKLNGAALRLTHAAFCDTMTSDRKRELANEMDPIPLIVHERRAHWARQLRPRITAWPAHLVETRSGFDLAEALRGRNNPLVLADLGARGLATLDELARALPASRDPLVLVLDPEAIPDVSNLARACGATDVWTGFSHPADVASALERWLALAEGRRRAAGWFARTTRPADDFDALLAELSAV